MLVLADVYTILTPQFNLNSVSRVLPVTIPSGYYLKHWNIPLISMGSNDPGVTNKDIYSTVVRLGIGYLYIGMAFLEVG